MTAHRVLTSVASVMSVVDDLDPISLGELEATASMLTRTDRKYLVPVGEICEILTAVTPALRVLEIDGDRSFSYENTYFDTPERRSYLDAARNRAHRYKVRTRCYIDAGTCVLEVKLRDGRGRTVKHRRPHEPGRTCDLDADARAFLRRFPVVADDAALLSPSLVTRYRRTALVAGSGRATVDLDLVAIDTRTGGRVAAEGIAIVETKTAGGPGPVDRALWAAGRRPARISKFAASVAAIHPELPANRWHRSLRALYPDQAAARRSHRAAGRD